jgi:hypothetical protein
MPLRYLLSVTTTTEGRYLSGSAVDGDDGYEVVKPDSRVLLPIELDYSIAKLDSFWQRCRADKDAEAFCAT